jgi:hypothetical protein
LRPRHSIHNVHIYIYTYIYKYIRLFAHTGEIISIKEEGVETASQHTPRIRLVVLPDGDRRLGTVGVCIYICIYLCIYIEGWEL